MKKSRFTETRILEALNAQQQGKTVQEICREYGIGKATFYKWKSKYSGMEASDIEGINCISPLLLRQKIEVSLVKIWVLTIIFLLFLSVYAFYSTPDPEIIASVIGISLFRSSSSLNDTQ